MWFVIGFLALVLVEIVLLVQLGGAIGIWLLLLWIVLTGGLGVILLKGIAMIGNGSLAFSTDAFEDPRNPMAHRGLVLIAGLFLLLPGPLTDTVGILLLFAPLRSVAIRMIARRFRNAASTSGVVRTIDAEWQDVTVGPGQNPSDRQDPQA